MFFGEYEVEVLDGKCMLPDAWNEAVNMKMQWLYIQDSGFEWYELVPEDEVESFMNEDGLEHVECCGDAVFADDGQLILPEKLIGDTVMLSGVIRKIQVMEYEQSVRFMADNEKMITELLEECLRSGEPRMIKPRLPFVIKPAGSAGETEEEASDGSV